MSSKKKVRFSGDLQSFDISHISQSMTPMILRSRCNGENCTASAMVLDRNHSFNHHSHHHHIHSSPISTESPSILKNKSTNEIATNTFMKKTVKSSTSATEEFENHQSFNRNGGVNLKSLKDTYNLNSLSESKESLDLLLGNKNLVLEVIKLDQSLGSVASDYSSGYLDGGFDERPKTGYTYSESRSYSSRVTPSRDNNSPNMSRTKIRSSNRDFSSDEETSFILHGNLHFAKSDIQTSTPMFYKNSANWEQNIHSQNDYISTESHSRNSIFSRLLSLVYYTFFLGVLNTSRKIWMAVWSVIYMIISRILIFDTWMLSRLRRNKFLLLLPLLLFLLLLWSQLGSDEHLALSRISTIPSSIISMVYSYFALLPDWSRSKFEGWTFWPVGVQSDPSHPSVYHQDISTKVSGAQFDMDKLSVLLKQLVSQESKTMSEKFEAQRNDHFQKILMDLQKQTSAFTSNQDEHMELLQSQSKFLSDELVGVKTAIAKMEEKGASDANVGVAENEFLYLKTKLNNLEAKLDILNGEIAAQRNCCKNATFYSQQADQHFVTLLLEVFNVSGDGQNFGQLRESLSALFTNQDDLKLRVKRMDAYLGNELREVIAKIVKEEAKINVADAINKLSAEIKYNESHKSASRVNAVRHNASDKCTSADEVLEIIKNALFVYDADKIGQVDFALESSGGSVISTRCAETYHTGSTQYRLFGIPFWYTSNSPRTVIQPEVHPGQCWAFKGTHGYLVIQLAAKIRPTAFTMEHIHKFVSPTGSIDSAPKDFSVYGLKVEDDFEGKLLGSFRYQDNNESLQYFIVADPDPGEFSIIELRVNSNHGNNEYTCLYRFRVHGVRV